jgi:hypothetical protein
MAVEVMPMGRIDVVAQPDPRVGHAHGGGAEEVGETSERSVAGVAELLQAERLGAFERAALEPRLDQVVVVVAGDDDELRRVGGGADRAERLAGALERLRQRAVAELDHVTEEDDPVGAVERGEQELADLGTPQRIDAAAGAEMEI